VDDESVLDQDFDGRVVRRFLSMELRKGVVKESLALDPGGRRFACRSVAKGTSRARASPEPSRRAPLGGST
jgi:hypothetical protein